MRTFFENLNGLPDVLKSKIYQFDPTYRIMTTEQSRIDIRQMSLKIKHTKKFKENYIQGAVIWENIYHNTYVKSDSQPFDNNFKIFIYPNNGYYVESRFKILRQNHDITNVFKDHDGFVCNEEEHKKIMSDVRGFRKYWFIYGGNCFTLINFDVEAGLYLYAKDHQSSALSGYGLFDRHQEDDFIHENIHENYYPDDDDDYY